MLITSERRSVRGIRGLAASGGLIVCLGLALTATGSLGAGLLTVLVLLPLVWLRQSQRVGLSTAVRSLLSWYLLAVAVRLVVVVAVTVVARAIGHPWWLFDDEQLYQQAGDLLVQVWNGQQPASQLGYLTSLNGYMQFVGGLFFLGGHDPTLGRAATALVSALVVPATVWVTRELFGPRGGRVAGWLSSFWPSLVLWGALLMKDGPTAAGTAVLLASATAAIRRYGGTPLVILAAALAATLEIRDVPALIVGWAAPVLTLAHAGKRWRKHLTYALVCGCVCLGTLWLFSSEHLLGLTYFRLHTVGYLNTKEGQAALLGNLPIAGSAPTGDTAAGSAGSGAAPTGGSAAGSAGSGAAPTGGSAAGSAGSGAAPTGGSAAGSAGSGAAPTGGSAAGSAGSGAAPTGGSAAGSAGSGATPTGGSAAGSAGSGAAPTGGSASGSAGSGAAPTGGSASGSAGSGAAPTAPTTFNVSSATIGQLSGRLWERFLRGFAAVAVEPFPFQFLSADAWLLALETLAWDVVWVLAAWGACASFRVPSRRMGIILLGLAIVGLWAALALFEDNLGNLFRHRSMLLVPCIVLAADRLAWLGERFSLLFDRRSSREFDPVRTADELQMDGRVPLGPRSVR